MRFGGFLVGLTVLCLGTVPVLCLDAVPAWAQAPGVSVDTSRAAPATLQSQLGSIPLVSPRAASREGLVRLVRLTQLDGGAVVGAPREVVCPDTGCQQMLNLVVDRVAQGFLADIQFVGNGIYVSLQSRSAAIGAVVEFRQGRPGPVFIKGSATGTATERIGFVTAPSASLRRLEASAGGNTLSSGNYYTRKREPDVVLRIEVGEAKPR